MSAAVCLLIYAFAFTWAAPPLLRRLDGTGGAPRLTVAAWLAAIASAATAWTVAVGLMVVSVTLGVHDPSAVWLCLRIIGMPEHIAFPGQLPLTVAVTGAVLIGTAVAGRRIVHRALRLRTNSIEHANGIRIVGAASGTPGVVLVDAPEPTAYCVAGRPNVIVVTTAAREALTEPELGAVLAHEQAHLSGRHHHILTLVRAFAQGLPHLPVFAQAPAAIARALEMCADDAAARRHSAAVLLSGLIKLAGQPAMAAHRMGAADSALVTRALRLAAPPRLASQWGLRLFTLAAVAITIATPVVGEWLCHY